MSNSSEPKTTAQFDDVPTDCRAPSNSDQTGDPQTTMRKDSLHVDADIPLSESTKECPFCGGVDACMAFAELGFCPADEDRAEREKADYEQYQSTVSA